MRYNKLGYVALNVTNVERSAEFYVKQVGLMPSGTGENGEVFLRCSEDHHNIVLCPSNAPGLKRVGVEMQDSAALDELAAKLKANGVQVLEVDEAEAAAWHQKRSIRFSDPFTGATFEC